MYNYHLSDINMASSQCIIMIMRNDHEISCVAKCWLSGEKAVTINNFISRHC